MRDNSVVRLTSRALLMLALFVACFSQVAAEDPADRDIVTAHHVVENTTRDLLALIDQAKTYIDQDEPRFFKELGELLHRYVDFSAFSRAVMGKYASPKRLESLLPEQQQKLKQQIDQFSTVFTSALINTYGKGLLIFEGEKIEVMPPTPEDEERAKSGKARVKQLIYGERKEPFAIYYSLRKGEGDSWKIRNMIIESTNLGKIYRNQFDNAYKVYDGDIDRVIANWVVTPESQ